MINENMLADIRPDMLKFARLQLRNDALAELAARHDVGCVATNNVHYATPAQRKQKGRRWRPWFQRNEVSGRPPPLGLGLACARGLFAG